MAGTESTRRRVLVAAAVCLLVAGLRAAEIIRVTPLAKNGRIFVSFEMRDAFNDDIRAVIQSGLTTTFSYDIDLRRSATLWFDKTMSSATVSASVRYDTLTRRYQLSRMQDGRVEESRVTEDAEMVRQAMTTFEQLPLFSTTPLEPNAEYYVRVRARTRPRNAWFFWPWDRDAASGVARFTFIP
ncbi:MAG: DUF4390 domain-containing protein [Acidobacteria bacterium]|nr:DUF4390 domain-containing protein [Acidobacteriota bacterium]